MMRPIGGFEAISAPGVGSAISGVAGANYANQVNMAQAAKRAQIRIAAAKEGADATRYAGQQAGGAAAFGGIMDGIGRLTSGVIGGLAKMPKSGGSGTGGTSVPSYRGSDYQGGFNWGQDMSGFSVGDPAQYWQPNSAWADTGFNRTGW